MLSDATKKTAILVDGGFYKIRAKILWGNKVPADRAEELYQYCMKHIIDPTEKRELYRIFYYDCPPMERIVTHPLTGASVDLSASPGAAWAKTFHRCLSEKQRVALRMGELSLSSDPYTLKDGVLRDLISGAKTLSMLTDGDFRVDVKQKGVDMRVGLDVASLAYGHYVNQVVLIAGDSDFLPAIKMARRHGLDFILDPMKQRLKPAMIEHVDSLESYT